MVLDKCSQTAVAKRNFVKEHDSGGSAATTTRLGVALAQDEVRGGGEAGAGGEEEEALRATKAKLSDIAAKLEERTAKLKVSVDKLVALTKLQGVGSL